MPWGQPEFTAPRALEPKEEGVVGPGHPVVADLYPHPDLGQRVTSSLSRQCGLPKRKEAWEARVGLHDDGGQDGADQAGQAGRAGAAHQVPRRPFVDTADPGAYVPREACELALAGLVAAAGRPAGRAALMGPPGIGKTLMLRVALERLSEGSRAVYLPHSVLALDDLCAFALGLASEPIGSLGPRCSVALWSQRQLRAGGGLVLALDDVQAMPVETADGLCELSREADGGLRLLVAAPDQHDPLPTLEALGPELEVVELTCAMTDAETREYVRCSLVGGGPSLSRFSPESSRATTPSEVLARFDEAAVQQIHRESGGIPRLVNTWAQRLMPEGTYALRRPVDSGPESWLGQPIDELGEADLDVAPLPDPRHGIESDPSPGKGPVAVDRSRRGR